MDTLVLQGYMWQALAVPAVTDLIGQRIYDMPPPKPVFPYITLGIVDGVENYVSECATVWSVTAEVHIWSREPGYPQGKRIALACDSALAPRSPVLVGMWTGYFERVGQRWLRDPDGLTSHGVCEYRAHYGPLN